MPDVLIQSGSTATSQNVVTTAETDVQEITNVATRSGGQKVRLHASCQMIAGTAATAITPRIRRGQGTGGTVVGTGNPVTVAAGNTITLALDVEDFPGEVANQAYSLTVQQTAATGNGSVLNAELASVVGG